MRLLTMVLMAILLLTLAAFPACAQSPSNPTTVEPAVEPAAASEQEPSEPEEETLLLRYYPPPNKLPQSATGQ